MRAAGFSPRGRPRKLKLAARWDAKLVKRGVRAGTQRATLRADALEVYKLENEQRYGTTEGGPQMTQHHDDPELDVDSPSPRGLLVTTDTPYHMLLVSDLAGSESGSLSGPLTAGVVDVNAGNFDDLMRQARPTVNYTTSDPLAGGNVMAEVKLSFDSVRAFEPQSIAQSLPATKPLMDIREKIVQRLRGKLNDEQLARAIAAASANASLAGLADSVKWTPAPPAAAPNVVDDVLSQLDLGGEGQDDTSASPRKSVLGSIISTAAGTGASLPAEQVAALRKTLTEIDRRVGAWVSAVLHSPQVQPLEGAWRSLAFLVSKIEFRKGVRLSVLHAPKGDLTGRFVTKLIDPVFDEGADAPHVVVVDHAFGNTAKDFEVLDEFAQHGASLPAIVVAGVSAQFFGVKHAWQVPSLPAIINIFDQWQFAKWKSLREQPYARALGVVFGRCLLRQPFDLGGKDADELHYHEERVAENDFCWANGSIAAACTIARSVAERGWPTAISGYAHGRIEGFKTAEGGKKGDKKYGPTDTATPQPKIEEMAAAGLSAVVGLRDTDDAMVWNGLTAARPKRFDPDALLEVSLPYQLFAGRLASLLFDLKPHLAGKSADSVASTVKAHVGNWVRLEGDVPPESLTVQTRPAEDNPKITELAVTVTPPQQILPGAIPVVVGYRLT